MRHPSEYSQVLVRLMVVLILGQMAGQIVPAFAATNDPVVQSVTEAPSSNSPGYITELVRASITGAVDRLYQSAPKHIEIPDLRPILKLKTCHQATAQINTPNLYGRVPVRVNCSAPAPWSFYVTTQVEVGVPAVVSTKTITRGEVISPSHVALREVPVQQRSRHTLTSLDQVVGKMARRNMMADRVVSLAMLETPLAIKKGDRVQITSHRGNVKIHTYGEAMKNGHIGQQIQVRNEASSRIIHPWVRAPGIVSTTPNNNAG